VPNIQLSSCTASHLLVILSLCSNVSHFLCSALHLIQSWLVVLFQFVQPSCLTWCSWCVQSKLLNVFPRTSLPSTFRLFLNEKFTFSCVTVSRKSPFSLLEYNTQTFVPSCTCLPLSLFLSLTHSITMSMLIPIALFAPPTRIEGPFDSRAKALPAKRSEKGYGDDNVTMSCLCHVIASSSSLSRQAYLGT